MKYQAVKRSETQQSQQTVSDVTGIKLISDLRRIPIQRDHLLIP